MSGDGVDLKKPAPAGETPPAAKRPKVEVEVVNNLDVTWIVVPLLFMCALAWGLGTLPGNRFMCEQSWAPVFIDCTKVNAP